jgi:aspartate racemase
MRTAMKKIGLIGGMSWQSSLEYYRIINELIQQRLGGLHSAQIILYSVDFDEIARYQRTGQWDRAALVLMDAARNIEKAGADLLLICANTMHKVAEEVEAAVSIPLLHIADAAAETVRSGGLATIGLLGTKFTMEQDFYIDRLQRFGLNVLVPNEPNRDAVHRIIYEELCRGIILEKSRDIYKTIIQELIDGGAEGIVLGCTEISLLIKQEDVPIPLFDTACIHALHAVEKAFAK